MKTALVMICTGQNYWRHILPAIESASKFFPADVLLFTDNITVFNVARQVRIAHPGWPDATLLRYHTILTEREWFSKYDFIYYMDICAVVVKQITSEIFADGIVATLQPHFVGTPGTPEENPLSTACLLKSNIRQYVTGAFQGGTSKAFLSMAEEISRNIDIDKRNNFTAVWHDESHLNRYCYDHPPVKILSADYCCPYPWKQSESTFITDFPKDPSLVKRPAVNGVQPFEPEKEPK